MIDIITLLVLGFAAYRVTRFLVIDSFFEGTREKFHTWLGNRADKRGKFRIVYEKILDMTSCTWCAGFWITLVMFSIYTWDCPIWFSKFQWISTFAIAGVQGILHALEPDND